MRFGLRHPRRGRTARIAADGRVARNRCRPAGDVSHTGARGAEGRVAEPRRHSGHRRAWRRAAAAHEERRRRVGDHARTATCGRISLRLRDERRHRRRRAQSDDEPNEYDGLQPRRRGRVGGLRHEERAARRCGLRSLPFDRARRHPPHARLHAAGLRIESGPLSGLVFTARRRRR